MSSALHSALQDAWDHRAPLNEGESQISAYRLFCGIDEGIRGLLADRYDSLVLLSRLSENHSCTDEQLKEIVSFYLAQPGIQSVYLKELPPDRSRHEGPVLQHLGGKANENPILVRENDFWFVTRPLEGFGSGLFMDQRAQRRYFFDRCLGKEVLNTFAYTCSFSVTCAAGGAKTTSVDISKKFLEWGKENFAANALHADEHEFFANDTLGFLQGAHKRGRLFDIVILDPPSFSRSKKGLFSVRKDAPQLLRLAASVTRPGGMLYFSSNLSEWSDREVQDLVRRTLPDAQLLPLPDLPLDFSYQQYPVSRALASLSREVFA